MSAIDYLADSDVVHVATGATGDRQVVTPIWSVVVDGVPYIRSAYGAGSKWYQRVQQTGRAAFVDRSRRYPATVENVTDEATIARVDDAYEAKYGDQGSALSQVVAPSVRRYTMRVSPED
jgi:hypothetical protein